MTDFIASTHHHCKTYAMHPYGIFACPEFVNRTGRIEGLPELLNTSFRARSISEFHGGFQQVAKQYNASILWGESNVATCGKDGVSNVFAAALCKQYSNRARVM